MRVPANHSSFVGSVDDYKERSRDFDLRHPMIPVRHGLWMTVNSLAVPEQR